MRMNIDDVVTLWPDPRAVEAILPGRCPVMGLCSRERFEFPFPISPTTDAFAGDS